MPIYDVKRIEEFNLKEKQKVQIFIILLIRRKKKEPYPKETANMKVKAGIKLLMADERVGELYSSPLFPSN